MKFITAVLLMLTCMLSRAQISFSYQNVKASDVVYSISKMTSTTIVAPEINTLISLQAKDISRTEALHILEVQLGVMKYVMSKEDGIYVVRQVGREVQDRPDPQIINQVLVTRVFQIHYGDAKNVASVVRDVTVATVEQRNRALFIDFLAKGKRDQIVYGEIPPTLTWDSYSNCLVVRGVQAQIDEIEHLLVVLDHGRNMIWTTKVYHLQYAQATSLSPILTNTFAVIVNGQYQLVISSYASGNALIVTCPENYIMQFDNLITCLDARVVAQNKHQIFNIWNGDAVTLAQLLQRIKA